MAKHPPLGHRDWRAWRDPVEGADLDPFSMDGAHGGFEVTELLLLLAVEPALPTGLLGRFVVAAVLVGHGAESGGGAHRPFANGNQRVVCTNGFGIIRRIAPGRCSAVFP